MHSLTLSCYFATVILCGDIVMKQAYRGYPNTINNSNGIVLQKILTVIDDANVFYFVFSYSLFYVKTMFLCFICVNQCFQHLCSQMNSSVITS